jgi:predicted lactoylglutathione lyase
MFQGPAIVSLPIEDRQRSFDFYAEGLGFETAGYIADDGLPEPLQLVVNDGLVVMLVPRDGFAWVLGVGEVAAPGSHEVLLSLGVAAEDQVGRVLDLAEAADGVIHTPAGQQPWGFAGTFADPDGHLWMVQTQSPSERPARPH